MNRLFLLIILLFQSWVLFAQDLTQTIKGRIIDQQSKAPMIGVNVYIENSIPLKGATSDINGYYRITQVPLGRITLKARYVGYLDLTISNVLVTAGKELMLDLEMEESVTKLQEVIVSANSQRNAIEKGLVSVSSKTFNVEDTRRYAGSRNDPARMVAGFAGVTSNNDSRNDIIIRGNSPSGVLWRLEGVDIPNPSHFGALGATGGPVSMLNNNLLAKSSFLTGAFPSMYGNATAGVFDLQLRNGNIDKREFTGQVGFNGIEAGIEGPFSKNTQASYLVNYRYSVLDFAKKIGLNLGTGSGVPAYQDLSFKLNFPSHKLGTFSLFGLGGRSNIRFKDEQGDNFYSDEGQNLDYQTSMGLLGLSNQYFFSNKTSEKITLLVSYASSKTLVDSLTKSNGDIVAITPNYRDNSAQSKLVASYTINHKWNAHNTFSLGAVYTHFNLNYVDSTFSNNHFRTLHDFRGSTDFIQTYANWLFRPTERLTFNSGLYFQQFILNGTTSLEPRLGMRYKLAVDQTLSIGLGRLSQLQTLQIYFNSKNGQLLNKNLDMTHSNQAVIGYEKAIGDYIKFTVETYYQQLTNVPVESVSSNFSLLNEGANFTLSDRTNLVNQGKGRNYGLEFTAERSFNKGFYWLSTLSLFNSKYTGSNGIEHNTAFNGNYTFNILTGKELKIGKNNTISFDTKVTSAGGRRYTPVNEVASLKAGKIILDESRSFENQTKDYFRADFKITFRQNRKKYMQEWFVDLQNITGAKNIYSQTFRLIDGKVVSKTSYQLGFFPNVNYRIQF